MSARPDSPRRRLEEWKRTPVWRLLAPCTRLVLDRMAAFGNGSGVCFPSIRTLAMLSDCHKATVERALAESKAVGILLTLGPPVPRKGVRGPGSVPYQVALRPKSVAELEEHVRVARGLRGREGRRLLTRGGIVRHGADNSRDPASGRFTAELSATLRTNKLSATLRTDPLVLHPEAGKPDGSVRRRVGAGAPRPPGSATPAGRSQGMAAKEEEGGLAAERSAGHRERLVAEVAQLLVMAPVEDRDRIVAELAGSGAYTAEVLGDARMLAAQLGPAWPDGARVTAEASGAGQGNGRSEGPPGIRAEPDLAADVNHLLETVGETGQAPGTSDVPRSSIRIVPEPQTEEEAQEVGRQMVVLRDHLRGFTEPPNEFHKARLLSLHFRAELIEAVVRELHGRVGGGSG